MPSGVLGWWLGDGRPSTYNQNIVMGLSCLVLCEDLENWWWFQVVHVRWATQQHAECVSGRLESTCPTLRGGRSARAWGVISSCPRPLTPCSASLTSTRTPVSTIRNSLKGRYCRIFRQKLQKWTFQGFCLTLSLSKFTELVAPWKFLVVVTGTRGSSRIVC